MNIIHDNVKIVKNISNIIKYNLWKEETIQK